ncbi:MAG: SPOR domain-containing protein [Bacteroidota bacterium]
MGRTVTYFVVALIIILGLTYMATQAESCAKKSTTSIHVNDISADKESDAFVEDTEEEDDEPQDEHDDSTGSRLSDEDADDSEVIALDGTEPEYNNDNDSNSDLAEDTSEDLARDADNSGDYLVIAGAFKNEANAKKEVEKLKNLGYPNTEIVEFDYSEFYSVCVAKYDASGDAEKVANALKNKLGKKAYVHKKREQN